MEFKHYVYVAILALGAVGIVVAVLFSPPPEIQPSGQSQPEIASGISQEEKANIEEYIRGNISTLSSEKEVLGGKFYVTGITWETDSSGIVSYEDGHIVLQARFTVSLSGDVPSVASFVVASSS